MKSTSIHNLNADHGLNFWQKPLYLLLNFVNNLFPYSVLDKRISIRAYSTEAWKGELANTFQTSSPGRRLSDLFWRTLPWDKIREELGEIHIFDVGCGHGNYALRLGTEVASYTGIDAKRRDNWAVLEQKHPHFHFIESSSKNLLSFIPDKANLFITQSAIEHFDEELSFFAQIKEFIDQSDKPVIQVHNFPARAILPLYLFHGIRQYTPRTVSKITRIFKDTSSQMYLYGLGGWASKKIQWQYFTWPLLIMRGKAKWSEDVAKYDKEVQGAIEYDMNHPARSPIFWVLIIHSNSKNKIW